MEENTKKPDKATQLKKMLYIDRPDAVYVPHVPTGAGGSMVYPFKDYEAQTSLGVVKFKVPYSEMGEKPFNDVEPARLLIRWLIVEEDKK